MPVDKLVPDANASPATILSSNDFTDIDETVASADGNFNDTGTRDQTLNSAVWTLTNLSDTPASLNSATFRVRARFQPTGGDDGGTYRFRLAIGGDTHDITFTEADASASFTDRSTSITGGSSYPYSEAQINAATVTLTQTVYNQNMSPDNIHLDIDAFELEVDFNAPTPSLVWNPARTFRHMRVR